MNLLHHMIKRLQILDIASRHHRLKFSRAYQLLQVKVNATVSAKMSTRDNETGETTTSAHAALLHARALEVTTSLPMTIAWEQLYKEGVTPWDAKGINPVISQLLQENNLREGMTLVPGCGLGYDVVAMASPTRRVIGLDISKTAVEQAKELARLSPNSEFVEFQVEDFFTYSPFVKFDFIFDYTFFCALSPDLRPEWAKKMAELLASDGELITLMFPVDDYEGGPPYAVSLDAYEKALRPWNFKVSSVEANIPSIPPRKGREKLVRWVRMAANL